MLGRLGKYELLEEIGHGGMATVTRARDTHLDRLVAVKVLHPHLRGAAEARSRFAREARSVARLHHPNILEIYDYSGEDSDESYLVMELLTGPTLKQWSEQHPGMPAEIAAAFTVEVLSALEAAHEAGIVHRDVKPENVLLHEGREVKLTDFGIAQMVDAQTFTATGQLLGSPCHMAPEQIERGDADVRSDVFSAGTVLYYLATGALPFAGKNPHQVMKQVVDGKLVDPLRLRPEIGARLRAILLRAMAREPADRYPDVAAFASDLRAFLSESGIDDSTAMLRRYLASPEETSRSIVAKTVTRLTNLGEAAAQRGDIPRARDAFERVLALDDGNDRVLALVAGLGRERSRGRWLAGLAAAAALGLAGWWVAAQVVASAPSAGAAPVGRETAPSVEPLPNPAAPPNELTAAEPAPEPAARASAQEDPPRPPRRHVQLRRRFDPRPIRFAFEPKNVLLSIDGGELRQVGPGYVSTELEPGRHTFRVEGPCCEPARFQEYIPPGDEPYELHKRLQYRAGLLVHSVPANVYLDGRLVGRTGDPFFTRIEEPQVAALMRVEADGFATHEENVRLRAGQINEFPVRLRPVEANP